jgi:crotonobetainyl-CoA:carnitine CoA-transferase CaiB-like acyl-CoA transferase
MANHSKQSRLLDEATDVEDLIREADVVVENWGKSRASRYGLDCASVGRTNPDALALSCSGFGHTGPLSHYRVYAYNLNAYCGLTDTMRGDSEAPPPLEFAWADFVSAFVLATVIAAWAVGSDGQPRQGSQVDLSMAEVIVQRLNLFVALSAMDLAPAATGLGDEGFRDLLIAVPGQESKVAVSLRDAADQETLDAILRGDQAHTTQGSLVRSLRQAGIFAGPLWGVREVSESDHLADRGFFAHITHQKWGKRRLIGLPWRFVGSGAIELGPPPVLRDPVGHSDTGTATDPDTERA